MPERSCAEWGCCVQVPQQQLRKEGYYWWERTRLWVWPTSKKQHRWEQHILTTSGLTMFCSEGSERLCLAQELGEPTPKQAWEVPPCIHQTSQLRRQILQCAAVSTPAAEWISPQAANRGAENLIPTSCLSPAMLPRLAEEHLKIVPLQKLYETTWLQHRAGSHHLEWFSHPSYLAGLPHPFPDPAQSWLPHTDV